MQYGQSNSRGSDLWISHSRSLPGFVRPKLDSGKLKSNLSVGDLNCDNSVLLEHWWKAFQSTTFSDVLELKLWLKFKAAIERILLKSDRNKGKEIHL